MQTGPQIVAIRRVPLAVDRAQNRIDRVLLGPAELRGPRFARSSHSLAAFDGVDVSRAQLVFVDVESQRDLVLDKTACGHVSYHFGNRFAAGFLSAFRALFQHTYILRENVRMRANAVTD